MGFFQIIGNVIWVLFGGVEIALAYFLVGILMCMTIIGIPFGLILFKIGIFALLPFGASLYKSSPNLSFLSIIFNILWLPFGLLISLSHLLIGLLFCITIIGIPFGYQHFKLMSYSFIPFGRDFRYN